jgi:glycosyltransferase involved in cell wall biosynthesis
MKSKKNIILVIFSDPMMFPPTCNAANILAEKGWRVKLLGYKYHNWEKIVLHPKVQLLYLGELKPGIANVINYCLLYFKLFYHTLRMQARWIYVYDAGPVGPACFCSLLLGIKWGYHNHDLFYNVHGWFNIIKYLEIKLAKKADFVSFPQSNRAYLFKNEAHLKVEPLIVYNSPRLDFSQVSKKSVFNIEQLLQQQYSLIIYQGTISGKFEIENICKSLKVVKSKIALIIIGKELETGELQKLKDFIVNEEVGGKIIFLRGIPYDELPALTKKCKIGLAKFSNSDPNELNNYYLIGASNKIAEYVGCGLTVLAPDTPVNKAFFDQYKIGYLCNPNDPVDIASSIDALITDKDKYDEISSNNRRLFNEFLCYDKQFEKVLFELNK